MHRAGRLGRPFSAGSRPAPPRRPRRAPVLFPGKRHSRRPRVPAQKESCRVSGAEPRGRRRARCGSEQQGRTGVISAACARVAPAITVLPGACVSRQGPARRVCPLLHTGIARWAGAGPCPDPSARSRRLSPLPSPQPTLSSLTCSPGLSRQPVPSTCTLATYI